MNNYVAGKDKLVQEIDIKAKTWIGRYQDYLSQNFGGPLKCWSEEKLISIAQAYEESTDWHKNKPKI